MPACTKFYRWPDQAKALLAEPELLIATVHTPKTQKREHTRQQVRTALFEILAKRLNCPIHELRLTSSAGQPPRLAAPFEGIGISFSHESGCSIIAINISGPVGIDLLDVTDAPSWAAEIPQLAADYLGPAINQRLSGQSTKNKIETFAIAWVAHEAKLKAQGSALSEWSALLENQLMAWKVQHLRLTARRYAAVAVTS